MKRVKVLLYAWDHEGLGHVNRLLGIIDGLKEVSAALDVFILAEQESPLLRLAGWPFLCVPRFAHSYKGHVDEELFPDTPESRQLKATTAEAMVATVFALFKPDMIIHDTVLWMPLFDAAAAHALAQVLIIRHRKDLRAYFARIAVELQHVAAIIFPHDEEEIEPDEIASDLKSKTYFSGPILHMQHATFGADTLRALQEKYHVGGSVPTVLLTGGGGGYAVNQVFFETAAQALADTVSAPLRAIVVLGCFYLGTLTLPQSPYITWSIVGYENGLPALMSMVDLVITQAGYNTINELQMVQTPGIVVPGLRPFDDQARRARQVASSSRSLHLVESCTKSQISTTLQQVFPIAPQKESRTPQTQDFPGYRRCAAFILGLLRGTHAMEDAL